MDSNVILKNGHQVRIRDMVPADLEALHRFFHALPEEDRRFLRYDVTRRDILLRRMEDIPAERACRLVAEDGPDIAADGTLELVGHGWGEGIAEIRLIVARPYQRSGLGTALARELYLLAAERKIDRVIVRMMRPQRGARSIFRKLGFRDEFVIPEHVRDRKGEWQDLVIMRCSLEDLWREMEDLTEGMDFVRHR